MRPLPLAHRWRTKQNLDYCFLMMYAQSKGIYYVQVSTETLLCPFSPWTLDGPGWQALPCPCAHPESRPPSTYPPLCSWRMTS